MAPTRMEDRHIPFFRFDVRAIAWPTEGRARSSVASAAATPHDDRQRRNEARSGLTRIRRSPNSGIPTGKQVKARIARSSFALKGTQQSISGPFGPSIEIRLRSPWVFSHLDPLPVPSPTAHWIGMTWQDERTSNARGKRPLGMLSWQEIVACITVRHLRTRPFRGKMQSESSLQPSNS